MKVLLRLILTSFKRQRSLYVLWILSLAAAVSGLVIVDVYRHSLTFTLQSQGRKILTADATVSARRLLNESELKTFAQSLPLSSRFARLTEMFAMVSGKSESRLALLRFVSDEYPLLGELSTDGADIIHGSDMKDHPTAWVAGDLLTLLDLKIGDTIKIGKLDFKLAKVLKKDSSQTFRMGNMAPRVYVHRRFLEASGLVQYGSTLSDTSLAAFDSTIPDLKKNLDQKFPDATVQITVPADLEQGSLRVLSQLLDYLGLTGLITLSLGWIGVYYLGRRWLALEGKSSGVLKCLGLSSKDLARMLLVKLFLILMIGVVLGGLIAFASAHGLLPLIKDSLPAEFELVWSWKNTLLLLVVGPMAGLLLLYQAIQSVAFEKPLSLFQERSQDVRTDVRGLLLLLVLVAALFMGLTFLQARSWRVTGSFIGALGGSVLLIAALAFAFLRVVAASRRVSWGWRLHLFTALWTRRSGTSLLLITVSALAGLLSQLLPHLEKL